MAAVRSTGNRSTEQVLAKALRKSGIQGWRRGSQLPGRPDFVFAKQRVAIFVDGCFWHGCRQCGTIPRTNAAMWRTKIEANQRRDRRVARQLRIAGWRVLRVWEHSLQTPLEHVMRRISSALKRPMK
jgi:DNA mismatch endonuclease, patch repair protein